MYADDVLEDLANSEEEHGCDEVEHGSNLAEDSDNNDSLKDEEDGKEDQRNQLVQRVERVRAVGCNERVVPVSSPAETSIEGDIASADKQDSRRTKDQSQRSKSTIIQELIADGTVHEKNPGSCDDRGDVYSRETPSHSAVEGEAANGEDFTERDDDEAEEEKLHLPSSNSSALPIRSPNEEQREGNSDTINDYRTQVGETSASSNRETDQVASAKAISSS